MSKKSIFFLLAYCLFLINPLFAENEILYDDLELVSAQSSELYFNSTSQNISAAGAFEVTKMVPQNIFSPSSSNSLIKKIRIYISNPNYSEVSSGIYDMEGREIRKNLPREGENVVYWDGKDSSGNIVESGPYIYQIEGDDKILSGVVILSK